MQEDDLGVTHPVIDENICVSCEKCVETCPNNIELKFHTPLKAYAAWSSDKETRKNSASGGIASELYKFYITNGDISYGVILNKNLEAHYISISSNEDLYKVRNSKYVFSEMGEVYSSIKKHLEDKQEVLFIGLPCQIAGLTSYLSKDYNNLKLVDLICHGIMPWKYLQQHVNKLVTLPRDSELQVQFRDPKLKTSNYCFTIRDKGQLLYKTYSLSDDLYQHGYHRGVCYRENCYSCSYARKERLGDLTLADFSGLGKVRDINYSKENVSCVLVNTPNGERLLEKLGNQLIIDERPIQEVYEYESMLHHPTPKPEIRDVFVNAYKKVQDYDYAADQAMHNSIEEFVYQHYSWHAKWINIKRKIKKILHR